MSASVTEPLFHLTPPAANVGELEVGQEVEGEYGPATVLGVEISKWRFSEKPKHRLTFLDHASGTEYARSYFPHAPLIHNQEIYFGLTPYHSRFRPCPIHRGQSRSSTKGAGHEQRD